MGNYSSFAKTAKKVALIVIVNILLLEFLSFCLIHSLAVIRPDLRLDLTVGEYYSTITDQDRALYLSARDERLGWNRKPFHSTRSMNSAGEFFSTSFGADGARNDPQQHHETLIATYGDSFTEGGEVNNDETWPFYLEDMLGYDVKNFGVGGYGIGQSFLKLQNHFENGRVAPLTMLVIYVDDLNRVVNNFRWFLNRNTAGKLSFKPSYRYIDGEIRFFPNPHIDESMTLDDLEALTIELASRDYWMTRWVYLVPQFPYVYQIIKVIPMATEKVIAKVQGMEQDEPIWNTQEGSVVVKHILEEFYKVTVENDSIPIVVFIPNVNDWKDGRKLPPYRTIKNQLLEDESKSLFVIDIYDADFDESRFSIKPFQGHPGPYGNKVIASNIASKLKELDLVD